jgi:hypothetical protein
MNIKKLKSRKFLLTLFGSIFTAAMTQVGLDSETAAAIVAFILGTYNIGQGMADGGEQGKL